MRVQMSDRAGRIWTRRQELVSPGRADFEYAQRARLPEFTLSLT